MNRDNNTRKKYYSHKSSAKQRDLEFLLTFDEWCDIWEESGKWENRGCGKDQYCMARYFDNGGYTLGNVRIRTNKQNREEWSHVCAANKIKYESILDTWKERAKMLDPSLIDEDAPYMPKYG